MEQLCRHSCWGRSPRGCGRDDGNRALQAVLLILPKHVVSSKGWSFPVSQGSQLYSLTPLAHVNPTLPGACKVSHATFLLYKSRLRTFQEAKHYFCFMPICSAQWGNSDQVASTYFTLKSLKRKTKETPFQEIFCVGHGGWVIGMGVGKVFRQCSFMKFTPVS